VADACKGYNDGSAWVTTACLRKLWADAGCTNQARGEEGARESSLLLCRGLFLAARQRAAAL
jgi:hypothetical protein